MADPLFVTRATNLTSGTIVVAGNVIAPGDNEIVIFRHKSEIELALKQHDGNQIRLAHLPPTGTAGVELCREIFIQSTKPTHVQGQAIWVNTSTKPYSLWVCNGKEFEAVGSSGDIEYIGSSIFVYTPDGSYKKGDFVLYEQALYQCNVTHDVSPSGFDKTKFTLVLQGRQSPMRLDGGRF